MRVLIAFPLRDHILAEELEEQLSRHAKDHGHQRLLAHIVHNAERAVSLLEEEDVTHCIVHEDLPPDRQSVPAAGQGLQFAEQFRRLRPSAPLTLIYTRKAVTDSDLNRLTALNAGAVRNSEDGIRVLIERVLSGMSLSCAQPLMDITIDLAKNEYRISSDRIPLSDQVGPLRLQEFELNNYLMLSKQFEEHTDWSTPLSVLKESLRGSLIRNHPVFQGALLAALSDKRVANNSCVHFRINQQQYDVAFEAIEHPHDKTFWMLQAPVFRSIADAATLPAQPLFNGSAAPLNCLLIVSAASGLCALTNAANEIRGMHRYDDLPQAELEFANLLRVFQAQAAAGRIGLVDEVGASAPLTATLLKAKITSQRWDIVHFIGHTDYFEDRALIILPGARPGEAQAIGLEEIAPLLARTRFVYLSSCKGTKLAFVRRLAEHGVPSVLGFRSTIRDDLALEHAQYFYERLFSVNSLERAFLSTRKHFHEQHPKERLWACSSLVMQR